MPRFCCRAAGDENAVRVLELEERILSSFEPLAFHPVTAPLQILRSAPWTQRLLQHPPIVNCLPYYYSTYFGPDNARCGLVPSGWVGRDRTTCWQPARWSGLGRFSKVQVTLSAYRVDSSCAKFEWNLIEMPGDLTRRRMTAPGLRPLQKRRSWPSALSRARGRSGRSRNVPAWMPIESHLL